MNNSRNSVIPMSGKVMPRLPYSLSPPVSAQTQIPYSPPNEQRIDTITKANSSLYPRALLISGGITMIIFLGAALTIPFFVTHSSSSLQSSSIIDTSTTPSTTYSTPTSPMSTFTSATSTTSRSTTSASTSSTSTTTTSTSSTSTSSTSTTTTSTTSTSTTTTSTTSTSTTSTSTSTTSTTTTSTTTTTTLFSLLWNAAGRTISGIAGSGGKNASQLQNPARITTDASDSLYIADFNNHRVQKYPVNATYGTTIAGQSNAIAGNTSTYLNFPADVAVDSNNNAYVVDSDNHRIQLWNVGASMGITVLGNGTAGNAINQFNYPRGITYDPKSGTLYISDKNNHRVISYSLNTSSINVFAGGNGGGKSCTQLNSPTGLAFDSSSNSLLINNYGSHNIVRWPVGATNWTLVAGDINGFPGNTSTTLNNPFDVALDSMNNIYVADSSNHRIQLFLVGQMNGTTIVGSTGIAGSSSTLLNTPASVAFDSRLNLIVSDMKNNRIQQFTRY